MTDLTIPTGVNATTDAHGVIQAATPADAAKIIAANKPLTIADNVAAREIFPDLTTALTRFDTIQSYPDAAGVTPIITGLTAVTDAEGNVTGHTVDESKYPAGTEVMFAKLHRNVKSEKPGESGTMLLVGLIVHPIPTVEMLFGVALPPEGTNAGADAAREIIRKEMNFRAVRPLRKALTGGAEAPSLESMAAEMPVTLLEYIEGQRSGGGIMESFDALARPTLDLFVKSSNLFKRARLTKPEFRKALESAAYARFHYSSIEEKGRFVQALTVMKGYAVAKGLSVEIFDKWAATRDAQSYDPTADDSDEEGAFDVNAMLAAVSGTAPAATA